MPEAVLAGVDPASAAIDQLTRQPLTIEELLRRRGILAVGGNSRMMPLQAPTSTPPAPSSVVPVASTPTSASPAGGGDPSVVPVTPPSVANPAAGDPAQVIPGVDNAALDGMTDNDLKALLAGMGIAGGSALAAYMLQRKGRGTPLAGVADTVAALPNNAPRADSTIIDGEYRVVGDAGQIEGRAGPNRLAGAIDQTIVSTPEPKDSPSVARSLANPQRRLPNYSGGTPASRREVGARQSVQSRQQRPDTSTIPMGDAYSDIPEEQMRHLRSLADELYAARLAGNRNPKTASRRGLPTGNTGDINGNGILNELVAIARRAAKNPNVRRGRVR